MAVGLSIIIVNWNGGELLKQCLASVAEWPPSCPYEIIIVDNASSDESVSWIKSSEAQSLFRANKLDLIENRENVGFSKANNQGIARSAAPLLLLLNPDTKVRPGAIDRLCATLRSDARIGACGPRLLNSDGSLQHSVWRNPPTPWEIIVSGAGLWRLMPKKLRGESVQEALRRENPYNDALAVARATRLRLLERGQTFASRETGARLERRIAHLEARSTLPRGKLRRVSPVLRELITLRYHRYSKGIQSAVKDLLT
jgi:glycosyltransferase involved in cell wall biosynthesis